VVATKRDAVAEDDPLPDLQREAAALGLPVIPISAVTGAGLVELKRAILALVQTTREAVVAETEHA
jgi:50S ribosomal subunit-associated GTPase HflX